MRVPGLALVLALLTHPATAQVQSASLQFPIASPLLRGVVRDGAVTLGVADDTPPFAFVGLDGEPIGYAVDVCRRVASDIAAALGLPLSATPAPHALALRIVRLPVAEQPAALREGTIDVGCSAVPMAETGLAASAALTRSGTRILAARLGPVSSAGDLRGRTVATVAGSQAAATIATLAATLSPPARIVSLPSPGDAYELLATGGADAVAADDLMLAGLLATRTDGPSFHIVGDVLDHADPAILVRAGDPAGRALVDASLRRMAGDGTLRASYVHWFTTPLPRGAALDRPPGRGFDTLERALARP